METFHELKRLPTLDLLFDEFHLVFDTSRRVQESQSREKFKIEQSQDATNLLTF